MKTKKALVMDFDGTLTDNRVWVSETGVESVACYRSDSMGIKLLKKLNFNLLVISAEKSSVVDARCKKMGVEFIKVVTNNPEAKIEKLIEWMLDNDLQPDEVVYIGNDLNDLSCMTYPGIYSVATADAFDPIKKVANYVTKAPGGHGAVREICDMIIDGTVDNPKDPASKYYKNLLNL